MKLQLQGIEKSFGALKVCRDINLSVNAGEMVCLIGGQAPRLEAFGIARAQVVRRGIIK